MSGSLEPALLAEAAVAARGLASQYNHASVALWHAWRDLLASKGISESELCFDGPALPETYFASAPRILVILREPNDCRQGQLLALLRTEAKWRAWRNVARWAAGIQLDFPAFDEVQQQAAQNEALRRIAAINIKKSCGGSSSDLAEIHDYAVGAAELHLAQISLLRPDLIIVAGTIGELQVIVDLESHGGGGFRGKLPDGHSFRVIRWYHPSARGSTRASYDRLRIEYRRKP